MTDHYLGIDFGTSGCRGVVMDCAGSAVAQASAAIPDPHRTGPRVEQDPCLWWAALQRLMADLQHTTSLAQVRAIAVDGTSATVLCTDPGGRPLEPALLYNDARATAQAAAVAAVAPADSGAFGASSSLSKLLWLREHAYGHLPCRLLHQADWIAGQLSGQFGISDENNCLKLGYDPLRREWPAWLNRLGVDRALLPRVVPAGTPIAKITPRIGQEFGLDPNTLVVAGTTDSTAAFLATGAHAPGDAVTSLGSTLVLKVLGTRPIASPRHGVYSHRLGNRWLAGGASNSGGAVLRQFFSDRQIGRLSRQIDPDRPTGLDYYPLPAVGERFPLADPALAPRLNPRPKEDVLFLQGIFEGIARIEQRGYALLERLGADPVRSIRSIGGGASNPVWQRIRAVELGVPLVDPDHRQAAYGAARLARQGAGQRPPQGG